MNACAWCKKIYIHTHHLGNRQFCDEDCMMAFFIEVGITESGTEFGHSREEIMGIVKEWKKLDYFSGSLER